MKASNDIVPLFAADICVFSRNLRRLLAQTAGAPGHLTLLNLIARSAGHRNYQALRAAPKAAAPHEPAPAVPIALPRSAALPRLTRRALAHFDTAGRLLRWPTQFGVQQMALWALWARIPARRVLSEPDVNRYLGAYHAFGDPATLRRELVNARLLWRTRDCRAYRKEIRRPGPEQREFLETLFEHTRES